MPLFVPKGLSLSKKGHIICISSKGEIAMEQLLTKIGELVSMEIDEVENVEYLDKEMGYMFYIHLTDGRKVLLSLVDSKM